MAWGWGCAEPEAGRSLLDPWAGLAVGVGRREEVVIREGCDLRRQGFGRTEEPCRCPESIRRPVVNPTGTCVLTPGRVGL